MSAYPPRDERHKGGQFCDKGGQFCDKAFHLAAGKGPVAATCVLRCANCGRVYARCAECNRGVSSAATSMRAHLRSCYRRSRAAKPGRRLYS